MNTFEKTTLRPQIDSSPGLLKSSGGSRPKPLRGGRSFFVMEGGSAPGPFHLTGSTTEKAPSYSRLSVSITRRVVRSNVRGCLTHSHRSPSFWPRSFSLSRFSSWPTTWPFAGGAMWISPGIFPRASRSSSSGPCCHHHPWDDPRSHRSWGAPHSAWLRGDPYVAGGRGDPSDISLRLLRRLQSGSASLPAGSRWGPRRSRQCCVRGTPNELVSNVRVSL